MLHPTNIAAFADPILDELTSGEPRIDGTLFLELIRQANGPVLELGSGYGRLTIPLAKRGITDITGLDLSAPSLEYARTKAGNLPIRWVEADVRDFHLGQKFKLVFARGCVFNFMLTREDQEAMLARVHEHLAEDGLFLVDTCYITADRMAPSGNEVDWFQLTHPNGRKIYISGIDQTDFGRQLWTQTCFERWDSPDGELVRPPWKLTLRYTLPQDMESLLYYNGFQIVSKYADYDGTPGIPEEPAIIFLCKTTNRMNILSNGDNQ